MEINGGPCAYDQGISRVMAVIRDGRSAVVGYGGWAGDIKNYFPMKARLTVHIVPTGDVYVPRGSYGSLSAKDVPTLKRVAAALEQGRPGAALVGAEKELSASDPRAAEEARRAVEALNVHAQARLELLAKLKASNPEYAAAALLRLAQDYAPSAAGSELLARVREWEKEPALVRARKARALWDGVQEAARKVLGKGKAGDPEFARRHGVELRAIAETASRLRKSFPETQSCRLALELASSLELPLRD